MDFRVQAVRVLLIVSVLSVGAVGTPATAVAAPQLPAICETTSVITPGASIGSLRLGMNLQDAVTLLPSTETGRHTAMFQGVSWTLLVQNAVSLIAKDGLLVGISMNRGGVVHPTLDRCSTPEGIGLEKFRSAVEQAYGRPEGATFFDQTNYLVYNSRGIFFRLVKSTDPHDNGQEFVADVSVFNPGGFCDLGAAIQAMNMRSISCADFNPPLK